MIRAVLITTSMAVLLGGCTSGAPNFGTIPPVALATSERQLVVPFRPSRFLSLRLRRTIDVLAEGNVQAVRASIVAPSIAQIEEVRQILISVGLDPARITASTVPFKRASNAIVVLSRTVALPSDCSEAVALAFPDDPTPSLLSLSRCVQNNNLAAMVVDPADLIAPPKLGKADGAYLANGVQSWRTNRQGQLSASPRAFSVEPGVGSSASSSANPTAAVVPTPDTQRQ